MAFQAGHNVHVCFFVARIGRTKSIYNRIKEFGVISREFYNCGVQFLRGHELSHGLLPNLFTYYTAICGAILATSVILRDYCQ